MRSFGLATLIAGHALANPVPQAIDWNVIDAITPVATPTIPVVNAASAQTTFTYIPTAAAAAVSASVQANPADSVLKRRSTSVNNTACAIQPDEDDTAENFSNNPAFSSAANSAEAPEGYASVYTNQNASSQGVYGYMGYSVLETYNVPECSKRCDEIVGCQSINVYFERDPSVDEDGCTDPPSTTVIKCVYWGGPVTPRSAYNDGQWRRDFHVVISGSNGYVNQRIASPPGYENPVFLDNGAIFAPADCNGRETYMGVKVFTTGVFDIGKCAAACSSQSAYNQEHPEKDGSYQTCQFFNTYILYNGTTAVGQSCSLYNETWPASFATNVGQFREEDYFSVGSSYAVSNSTGNSDQPQGCTNPTAP